MTLLREVRRAFAGDLWAVEPIKFAAITQRLALRASGERLTPTEIRAALGGDPAERGQASKAAGIAVLPIYGLILNRASSMDESSGVYGLNRLSAIFDALVADDGVRAIVLELDTPGGMMAGTPEFAAKIFAARGTKPIVAVANQLAASAGYWIAAACDEVIASPSALLGSIGVMAVHEDDSLANEAEGVKYTIIAAPQFKAEGNGCEPLTDEARAQIESRVLEGVKMFESAVAEYRGVSRADVSTGFGQGRVFTAKAAVKAGLADRVATMDETLARLGGKMRSTIRSRPGDRAAQLAAAVGLELGSDTLFDPILNAALDLSAVTPAPGRVLLIHAGDSRRETAPDAAVSAPAAPSTPPAPVAANTKDTTMTEEELRAQAERSRLQAEENVRLKTELATRDAFEAIGREHAEYATHLATWRAEGKSPDQARTLIAADLRARLEKKPALIVGSVGNDRAGNAPWGVAFAEMNQRAERGAIKRSDVRYVQARNEAFGNQLKAIAEVGQGRAADPRLFAAVSGASANVGSDGAFLIQKEFTVDTLESTFAGGELLSRVDSHEVGANADGLEVAYLDETSRATGSRWGGVQVYRGAEADSATAKKPKIGKWEVRLEDIIGSAYMTERLLQDAPSMASVFMDGFAAEFQFMVESEIFAGSGTGQCMGYTLSTGPRVKVAKETGQAAATIVYENIKKMWARVHPRSKKNGVWFINTATWPQIADLQIGLGTAGATVWMPPGGISGLPYATLYGRPVIEIEYAEALGTEGDISFADLSRYKVITKGGLQADESIHVRFLNNERTFRWTTRVNGAPKDKSAITPFKGTDTLSPFVTLATR